MRSLSCSLKAKLHNKIIQATIHFINVTYQIVCCCYCGIGDFTFITKCYFVLSTTSFSLIYLYYCCHKHLLRNSIKNQLFWPDHCTYVNLLLCSTYVCSFRAFYLFTSFTDYVIQLNISSYWQFVVIVCGYLA